MPTMHARRFRCGICLLVLGAALAGSLIALNAPRAEAGTAPFTSVQYTTTPAGLPAILITAGATASGGGSGIIVTDLGDGRVEVIDRNKDVLAPIPPCEQVDVHTVRCPLGTTKAIHVFLTNYFDRISIDTSLFLLELNVDGSRGKDHIKEIGISPASAVLAQGPAALTSGTGDLPDTFIGGAGSDLIVTGPGTDKINGGGGNDTLKGGAARDRINGGAGRDRINGGAGNDSCQGGAGRDTLRSC